MSPLDAAWEAVLGAPDDDRALCVLADALMEVGDPHGEFIRLQLSGGSASAHLSRHAAELVGDPLHLSTWSPRFERGFIESIQIATAAELEAVLQRPVGRLLRKLDVSALSTEPISAIGQVLALRGPRTLSTLWFGRGGLSPWAPREVRVDLEHPGELELAPITARLTSLEQLALGSWAMRFEGASSTSLRSLSLNLQHPVHALEEARFPALVTLELELPYRAIALPPGLLQQKIAPQLRSLTLRGALWPPQLRALAQSPLLQDLTRLEIAAEAETAWYPALLQAAPAFAHLEQLDLIPDRHYPDWVAAVKAALPRAIIREPRLRL